MKGNQPLVSIIMPVYGVEKYIEQAINSVISQSYKNWELLIINDGTKDNSKEIAELYASRFENIYLYNKENGGLSDARNFGLKFVQGKYIHFFDSDDWINPSLYAETIPLMESSEADFLVFGYQVDQCDKDDKVYRSEMKTTSALEYPLFPNEFFLEKLQPFINFAWNKIFRRNFLESNKLFFEKGLSVIEDQEFISRTLPLAKKVLFISYVGYHYMVRHRETLSANYNSSMLDLYKRALSIERKFLVQMNVNYDLIDKKLEHAALFKVWYLLQLLYHSNFIRRKEELRYILNDSYMRSLYMKCCPQTYVQKIKKFILVSVPPILIYYVFEFKRICEKLNLSK